MQLAHYIVFHARLREDDPAVGFGGGVATYGLLAKAAETAISKLQEFGLSRTDLVALRIDNPFQNCALLIALRLMGQPTASIFARAQIEFSGVTPAVVLTDRPDFALPKSRIVLLDDTWFTVDPNKPADYAKMLAMPGFTDPEDIVQVSFSSGTTGYPKAVATRFRTVDDSTHRGTMLYAGTHSHALRGLAMTGVSGAPPLVMYVLSHGGFLAFANKPDEVLRLVKTFDLEVLFGSVGQLQSLLPALGSSAPPRSLRSLVAFGSRIPKSLLDDLRTRLSNNLHVVYASSEAGLMAYATGALLDRHEGCVGYVVPGIMIETVDDQDSPVPPGEDGIIRVKTSSQNYYLHPTAETDAMFRDGWFYPGDIGRLHADGLLTITGRVSEVINRGGVIVAPEMVEDVLRTMPGIKDVAVFGVPDQDGLDRIWAAVVSDNWVDGVGLRSVLAARIPDRTPERIVQVDAIPRTDSGKIKRRELRERFASQAKA